MATSCSKPRPTVVSPKAEPTHISLSQAIELLDLQDPRTGETLRCHGLTAKGTNCQINLSKASSTEILASTRLLTGSLDKPTERLKLLEDLSKLVMCKRFHQGQAGERFEKWKAVPSLESSRRRCERKAAVKKEDRHDSDEESGRVKSEARGKATIINTPSSRRESSATRSRSHHVPSETENLNSPKPLEPSLSTTTPPCTSHTHYTRSKSTTSPRPPPSPTTSTSTFTSYHLQSLSSTQAASQLKTKLHSPLLKTEHSPGWIYAFTRPSNTSFLKIGYTTTTPQQRLYSIGRACGYTPILIFQHSTPHAKKVEALIHKTLHAQRRREELINGACNAGKGCSARHMEWFEIDGEVAEGWVRGWVAWMESWVKGNKDDAIPVIGKVFDQTRIKNEVGKTSTTATKWAPKVVPPAQVKREESASPRREEYAATTASDKPSSPPPRVRVKTEQDNEEVVQFSNTTPQLATTICRRVIVHQTAAAAAIKREEKSPNVRTLDGLPSFALRSSGAGGLIAVC